MLVGALLCRNEAAPDRYLRRALKNAASLCDKLIILDDGSDDETAEICREYGEVHQRGVQAGFWTDRSESTARAELWHLAAKAAGPEGWIYFFDADHELLGLDRDELVALTASEASNAWCFPLYDCWDSDKLMRTDGYWQAHNNARPWLVKALPADDYVPEWNAASIHSGHIPPNYPLALGLAPSLAGIRHLGYIQRTHREAKAERYLALDALSAFQRSHAESIMDESPVLEPIPQERKRTIMVASIVRKPPEVVAAFCKSLAALEVPKSTELKFVFLNDYAPHEETQRIQAVDFERELPDPDILHSELEKIANDYGEGEHTRHWSPSAFERVALLKNGLIQKALDENYDYLWLIDADVICGPETLKSLVSCAVPIVSGVYWTRWQRSQPEAAAESEPLPQVWLRHPYQLDGNGYSKEEFLRALENRQLLNVGGLGACTLIARAALEKGVSFSRVEGLTPGPMADGEDRHFCARAQRLHIGLFADAWPDIYHAYHPSEYGQLDAEWEKLLAERPAQPSVGDMVSFKLKMLEPLRGQQRLPLFHARGRLGQLRMLPEIEEAILSLQAGERKIVKARFPHSYEIAELRGATRVMELELLDVKPYRKHPSQ